MAAGAIARPKPVSDEWEDTTPAEAWEDTTPATLPEGFWKSLWEQINPSKIAAGVAQVAAQPGQTVKTLGAEFWGLPGSESHRLMGEAQEAAGKGDYLTAVRKGANSILNMAPGLGSTLDVAAEQASRGDIGGAIGTTAGFAGAMAAPVKGPRLVRAAPGAARKAATAIKEAVTMPGTAEAALGASEMAAGTVAAARGHWYAAPWMWYYGQKHLMKGLSARQAAKVEAAAAASRAASNYPLSDLKSVLRNQGMTAAEVEEAAVRAQSLHPTDFNAAIREAIGRPLAPEPPVGPRPPSATPLPPERRLAGPQKPQVTPAPEAPPLPPAPEAVPARATVQVDPATGAQRVVYTAEAATELPVAGRLPPPPTAPAGQPLNLPTASPGVPLESPLVAPAGTTSPSRQITGKPALVTPPPTPVPEPLGVPPQRIMGVDPLTGEPKVFYSGESIADVAAIRQAFAPAEGSIAEVAGTRAIPEGAYPIPEAERVAGKAATAPAYEKAARTVKARALARFLSIGGIGPDDVMRMTPEHWKIAAEGAGVRPPSTETMKQVAKELERIQNPQAAADALAGKVVKKPKLAEQATIEPGRKLTPAQRVEVDRLQRGIAEGEMRIRSGVNSIGEKLSSSELQAVRRSVAETRRQLTKVTTGTAP